MAKKRQTFTPQLVEMRRQLEEEDRQQCATIIAEFRAETPAVTMYAMAKAILRYRRTLETLGCAVDWAKEGKPITVIGPGPHWGPERAVEDDGVPPAA